MSAPDGGDLVVQVARFAGALRGRGMSIGIGDELDGIRALTLIDVGDRSEVHLALRSALKVRRRDFGIYDEVFAELWSGNDPTPRPVNVDPVGRVGGALRSGTPVSIRLERDVPSAVPDGDVHSYSPEAVLRRKPFDECSGRDLVLMERLLARLSVRLATRRSRRLAPTRGRGRVDLRRSLRRSILTAGELVSLAHRARRVEKPRLVVLCDTSGSMEVYTKFLLAFVLALKRVVGRLEVFFFNTSLTRATPWIAPGKIAVTLERLAAGVAGWSGGTRIGESLTAFVARYGDELLTRATTVVILSDGLDRGDTMLVTTAMKGIRARARRVIWLNPLTGDPRYEPTARAMEAALPFIDRLAAAHNLESLERALPDLAA